MPSVIDAGARQALRQRVLDAGAYAVGFDAAVPVSDAAADIYQRFITEGRHGSMGYLERYADVRRDPRLLLDGARSLIISLFAYPNDPPRSSEALRVADYALGEDYHTVLHRRLAPVCQWLDEAHGAVSRVCVDTAPLRERYWAQQAGLGFVGRNNQLTVPGVGAHFFIATIVTTAAIMPDEPMVDDHCGTCRRCIDACPAHALDGNGGCDARRCLSYLTIENREPVPDGTVLRGNVYGCDICRLVCPHNHGQNTPYLPEFTPRQLLLTLTADQWAAMTPAQWRHLTDSSAMRRTRLPHLQQTAQQPHPTSSE